MAGEELTRIIFLEQRVQDLLRRLASLESLLAKVAQDARMASMSTPFGNNGSGSESGYGYTNEAIAAGATGEITLDSSEVVDATNPWVYTDAPSGARIAYLKVGSTYTIRIIDCDEEA
jgi:hypothetical protein